ncbi:MAG TPA: outer membrane beta-barrel protein, partial [Nannocystis sp.]
EQSRPAGAVDEDGDPEEPLPGTDPATADKPGGEIGEHLLGPAGVKAWEVGGFVDVNYGYNSNQPDNHVYRGTSVQPRTGEFSLNHIVAYLRRDPTPGRTSLRMELALQAGPAADALVAYEPNPGGANGKYAGPEVWKHLSRANVGVRTRSGFEVVGGLQLSPVGIGLHWNPYNWNYTVTWQLNSVPYYLQGIRLAQTIRERHQVLLWVVNGWQILSDNNRAPSVMLGYVFSASPRFSLAEYAWVGPEQADMRPQAWRLFSDSQFTYDTERFGIAGLFDVGADPRTDLPGRPWHMWMSAALFGRWHVLGKHNRWEMAARPELFWDRDGRVFGVPQTLVAGTFTNNFRVLTHLLLRLEYRYDWSSNEAGFFYRGPAIADDAQGLSRQQHTVFFSVAGVFAHRFGGQRR